MPVGLRFGNPAGTFYKYCIDYLFPASPPHSTVWYKERTINTELRQKVIQYSVLLSHGSVMAQLFSPHHQHHLQHLAFSTSPEREETGSFCWAVTLPVLTHNSPRVNFFTLCDIWQSVFKSPELPSSFVKTSSDVFLAWWMDQDVSRSLHSFSLRISWC